MGITGLLPSIRKAQPVKISQLKGYSFVIDGHCFLHAAAIVNPRALVLQQDISGIVNAMVHMISTILSSATFVCLVFDGGSLPSKGGVNSKRKEAREANLALAKSYLASGNSEEATNALRRAVSFTPLQVSNIANNIFKRLEQYDHFAFIIAPYEADAQIAYLQKIGLADVIVTNDSDILLYGPRKVLYKFNWRTETGFLTVTDDLYDKSFETLNAPTMPSRISTILTSASLKFDPDERTVAYALARHLRFQQACILSGCDYVPSLVGVGLVTSVNTVTKYDGIVAAAQVLRYKFHKKLPAEVETFEQYIKLILQAYLTFRYHQVFDPLSFQVVSFYPINERDIELTKLLDQWCYGAPFTSLEACLASVGIVCASPYTYSDEPDASFADAASAKEPGDAYVPAPTPVMNTDDSCTHIYRCQLDDFSDEYVDICLRSLQRVHHAAARAAIKNPVKDEAFQCSTVLSIVAADGITIRNGALYGPIQAYPNAIDVKPFRMPFARQKSSSIVSNPQNLEEIIDKQYDIFTGGTITHTVAVSGSIEKKLLATLDLCRQITRIKETHSANRTILRMDATTKAKTILSSVLPKECSLFHSASSIIAEQTLPQRETRESHVLTHSSSYKTKISSSPLVQSNITSFQSDKSFFELSDTTDAEGAGVYSSCSASLSCMTSSSGSRLIAPKLHSKRDTLPVNMHGLSV